ncbi:M1 family metallopeptidase [Algibacter sp.]|nr:M1 family metallopeptidase [Algibacter sp.]
MNRFFIILCFCSNFLWGQQTDSVDFKRVESVILFNQTNVDSTVFNSYQVKFHIIRNTDSVYLDAINMRFLNVALNEKPITFKNDGKKLIIYNKFEASTDYTLNFLFFASPKKAMYFVGWDNGSRNQIWTQGQGKYTSHWLPSIDDMNDKIEFDLSFVAPKDYQVVSNGRMVSKRENPTYNLWEFDMQNPMSSYLVALVIGKYDIKVTYSKSGIPLEMYYYPEDSLKFEPTYRYSKQMFDFLEEEIGVPYPWQNYKQVPVQDFLYAGMENTSATIFADSFVIDSIAFVDKNYVNVNAHELAHQWFGDLVTETSGTHHWLHEGFATYYALLAERDIFGDEYYYWRLYEYSQELLEQDKAGQSTSLLDSISSSTTFYKKGAWVLHMLREKVGDRVFKNAVKNYLEKYQFGNVETNDFISEVEKASGQDLTTFVGAWLEGSGFLYENYINPLKSASKEIAQMISLEEALLVLSASDSLDYSLNNYWENATYPRVKSNLFSKKMIQDVDYNIIKKALKSNDLKLRQAAAQALSKVPLELKTDYETLLGDKSYITIQAALFGLWNSFPEVQNKYLDQTKGIEGFNDKNVRILWLALVLISEDYESDNQVAYFNELTDYTSPKYGFEIRENAFKHLLWISACAEDCEENLKQATTHHNWRFSKYAKETLKTRQ